MGEIWNGVISASDVRSNCDTTVLIPGIFLGESIERLYWYWKVEVVTGPVKPLYWGIPPRIRKSSPEKIK